MLFFKVGPNPQEWWGEVLFSHDGGRSFRDRRRLPGHRWASEVQAPSHVLRTLALPFLDRAWQ